jgi:hypothetical protein
MNESFAADSGRTHAPSNDAIGLLGDDGLLRDNRLAFDYLWPAADKQQCFAKSNMTDNHAHGHGGQETILAMTLWADQSRGIQLHQSSR